MANKNFEVKHGLSVGGTERISSAGVGTFTDLNVTGTTTTIDTATLQVQDKNIVINYGTGDTSSTANGAGITIQDAVDASNDATLLWDNSNAEFDFSHAVTAPSLTIAGAATFDGSTLAVDATNDRVGIGTTSPDGTFHVKTTSGVHRSRFESGSSHSLVRLIADTGSNAGLEFYSGSGNVGNITVDSSSNIIFEPSGTERVRIDSAGTIFQHVTSPTLHSAQTGIVFTNGSLISDIPRAASRAISLAQNAAVDSGNTWAYLSTDEASLFQQFNGNHYFKTAASGSAGADITFDTKMFISNTGKTSWSAGGIGTVTTQNRDFTFYTEGSTNGVDIRSNDYRNILLGAGGSSGAAMDAGYIGIYKDGSTKIAFNANGDSYIDGGNVGIGTSSPTITALSGVTSTRCLEIHNEGNDTATGIRLQGNNNTGNPGQSTTTEMIHRGDALYFHLRHGGSDAFVINSNRDVHYNAGSTDFRLRGGVYGSLFDSNPNMNHNIRYHASAGLYFNVGPSTANFVFEQQGTARFQITSSGGSNVSDIKLKENVEDITYGLDTVKQLQARKFDWKGEDIPADEKAGIGFIAQEVEEIIPEVINEKIHPDDPGDGSRNIKSLNYSAMTSVLVKAIQELEARVKELEG